MRERRALRGMPLLLAAFAGIVAGHAIAYGLAVSPAPARAALLLQTGHGYWGWAVKSAVALFVMAVAWVVGRSVRGVLSGRRLHDPLVAAFVRLAALQVVGFAAMEVTERLAAGAPLSSLFLHHLFVLGVGVQLLVAFAVTATVAALRRSAEAVVEELLAGWQRRRRPAAPRAPREIAVEAAGYLLFARPRGPPLAA